MAISEQITLAAIFNFEQVFLFCMLLNKTMLEWFLLIMWKEQTLTRYTNFLVETIPHYVFDQEEKVGKSPILINFLVSSNCLESYNEFLDSYFLTKKSFRLKFFWTVTSETIFKKKQPSSFCKHELSIFISCLC